MFHTVVDWILTERCNLNCHYCLQGRDTRREPVAAVDGGWLPRASRPALVHLTGGEPFLVPNLIGLCRDIEAKGYWASLNTNLTLSPAGFAEEVSSERFLFVNASYHYPYRKEHLRPFVRHCDMLRERGFFLFATTVMMPGAFDEQAAVVRQLQREGILSLPKLMRGREQGVDYPAGYTAGQWERMRALVDEGVARLDAAQRERFALVCDHTVSIDNWLHFGQPARTRHRLVRITERGEILDHEGNPTTLYL